MAAGEISCANIHGSRLGAITGFPGPENLFDLGFEDVVYLEC